jgi:hypothetical protein
LPTAQQISMINMPVINLVLNDVAKVAKIY